MHQKTERVLLVGPMPPPNGGMALQAKVLLDHLIKEQHDVVFVPNNPAYPKFVENIKVLRAVVRLMQHVKMLIKTIRLAKNSGRPFDVVHILSNSGTAFFVFTLPACFVAKCSNIPVMINYRGGLAGTFLEKWSWLVAGIFRKRHVTVPSTFLQDVFEKYDIETSIVPNIVNLSDFTSKEHTLPDAQAPKLLVTRNLEPIYNNETVIKAMSIVLKTAPNATLKIAGSGPEKNKLCEMVENMGLENHIEFVGKLDRNAMIEAYHLADIAINPSLADNMPNSVLEALAVGVPVVSTNVGGVPHMVKDRETASLIPPKSPELMAEKIIELLNDPALYQHYVQQGQAQIAQYTWPSVYPILQKNYQSAIQAQS